MELFEEEKGEKGIMKKNPHISTTIRLNKKGRLTSKHGHKNTGLALGLSLLRPGGARLEGGCFPDALH